MAEKIGIDKLKKIFIPLVKTIAAIVNATDKDSAGGKKIVWTELVGMVPNGIQILLSLTLLAEIWKQVKHIDALEAEELGNIFAEEFDIADDDIESAIEDLLEIGVSFGPPVEDLIEWFKIHVKGEPRNMAEAEAQDDKRNMGNGCKPA